MFGGYIPSTACLLRISYEARGCRIGDLTLKRSRIRESDGRIDVLDSRRGLRGS
jgi:hypothetical protein